MVLVVIMAENLVLLVNMRLLLNTQLQSILSQNNRFSIQNI
jgi:hypothetical protein